MIVLLCHERAGASFCHRSSEAVAAQSRDRHIRRNQNVISELPSWAARNGPS